MNTTATYSSELAETSWSRRCSTETIFSIQSKETDFVKDTTDTEWDSEDGVEYEPVTESEDNKPQIDEPSDVSDFEIIKTQVIEVSVADDGALLLADSELTSSSSDSELDYHDFWLCSHCRATNNNPLYRYCESCFKVRKNLFPPRPKRRNRKKSNTRTSRHARALTPDSGLCSALSEELASSQNSLLTSDAQGSLSGRSRSSLPLKDRVRSDSELEPDTKRRKIEHVEVSALNKTVSDPSVTLDGVGGGEGMGAKADLCIVCVSEPKSGVFVHGRVAHICCCYRCAVKVWNTAKRCPVCNCKVNNVLRAIVM